MERETFERALHLWPEWEKSILDSRSDLGRIASELLLKFPTAFSVAITLRKHRPPFMSGVRSAGVSLLRRRSPAAGS